GVVVGRVGAPLPDAADHVEEAVGALPARVGADRERPARPLASHAAGIVDPGVSPGITPPVGPARGLLPLGLARQPRLAKGCVGLGLVRAHADDRVVRDEVGRPLGFPPEPRFYQAFLAAEAPAGARPEPALAVAARGDELGVGGDRHWVAID